MSVVCIQKDEKDSPSLDTTYLPRKPVHPKTVTTCPLTALYPGVPAEMMGLFGSGVTKS